MRIQPNLSYAVNNLKDNILSSLSELNKKIIACVAVAFIFLTACFLIYRCSKKTPLPVKAVEKHTSGQIMDLAKAKFADHPLKDLILKKLKDSLPTDPNKIVESVSLNGMAKKKPKEKEEFALNNASDFLVSLNTLESVFILE